MEGIDEFQVPDAEAHELLEAVGNGVDVLLPDLLVDLVGFPNDVVAVVASKIMEDHGKIPVGEVVDVAPAVSRSPELSRAMVVVPHLHLTASLREALKTADMTAGGGVVGSSVLLSHDHSGVPPHLRDALLR